MEPNADELELVVEPAAPSDVRAVLELREEAVQWLLARGIRQWESGELTGGDVRARAEAGELYVARVGGAAVATVTLSWDDQRTWGPQAETAGYTHTLIVARSVAGRGLGCRLLTWAEARIVAEGRFLARLDCVRSNRKLRKYYEEAGYRHVGDRDFSSPGWNDVALYERALGTEDTGT